MPRASRSSVETHPAHSESEPHDGGHDEAPTPLPILGSGEIGTGAPLPATGPETEVAPRTVGRGVIAFDLDGTILDSISLISHVAADVLHRAFGTPPEEGRIHYLATTGMPFEAQLSQLYPEIPADEREGASRIFHQRKITEAYTHAALFAEVPRVIKRLDREGWTLVITTGAEREMADLLLEREGLRVWFEGVLGSGQGTKREHLKEYQRRFPGVPVFLVGDSRFDMEAARDVPGVIPIGRATNSHGWSLTPADLAAWGARWAAYSLEELPDMLPRLLAGETPMASKPKAAPAKRRAAARPRRR
ncbi:MAG: HAD hydrolase-like protein [Thermoplasmata archaeon]|nr:HAD hydrolase-like protein [Thermoplasmata archaeon]